MDKLNKETFAELIEKEYEDWCNYFGKPYLKDDDTDEDLFEFVRSNVKIDNKFFIEELDEASYKAWEKFFNTINTHSIWNTVYDYNHPWSDWDNCDADFYGV